MEIKSRELSRREKRKEARLAKKKNRLSSWMQHQEISKLKRSSLNSNPKGEVQSMVVDVEKGVMEEQPSNAKEYEEKLDSLKDLVPTSTTMKNGNKSLKRKSKTKFEEFLEMDTKKDVISAEEDLRLERKLAKKLKVKSGKLRGIDDEVDMLFDGIPSILDSSMDEEPPDAGDDDKRSKHNSSSKKNKKRKLLVISEGAQEDDPTSDTTFGGPKPTTSGTTKVAIEEPFVKVLFVDGNAKYIAPYLRSRAGNESEEYTQLRRRVRGLLNRLSESNVESITQEMSTIFSSVGRSFGSQMISEEVLASCSGGPRGNEQYASVFAAFVAGMACLVGVDFGAKLIASLAKCFEEEYLKEDNLSLRNLTLLLSYLYIFGVCSSELIYDFLIILSKRLMEIDVSTILTILKCCGMKLRGDDPTAMKDFIFSVQNRVNELKSPSGSKPDDQPKINNKRMEFMLETICDIKNNKRRSKEDSAQHTRIKKWLQKLRVEDILLRGLKWSKLLDPHKKGQWWLSGDIASTVDNVEELANRIEKDVSEAHEMLQLAAAQGMNTDTRRAIYCVIMRAEDCVDGFRNLIKLNLHGKQDRDIMRVLLECCLQEIIFNRYYTILASKLCEHNKNNKFTLQYCLWDYFKEINSIETKKSMHLARFIAEMFASFTLSLAVLKVVDLCDTNKLNARGILHFKLIFEAIFKFSDDIVWNIFSRVAVITDLRTLRNGMKYFIKKYVVKRDVTFPDKFKIAAEAMENLTGVLR